LKAGAVSDTDREERSSLEEISIRNLGVIESATIEFSTGLTVLTGETGAGKTMVLTALGLVLGSKADADLVRTGADRSIVSARFRVAQGLSEKMINDGEDLSDGDLILARTVSIEGKSRVNIGGAISTVARAGELAGELIEIHGQSQNAKLLKSTFQRELLDSYTQAESALNDYQMILAEYTELDARIFQLQEQGKKVDQEIASVKEFAEAFSKVLPMPNELTEIDNELLRLGSLEELHSTITNILNLLEDEDRPTTSTLRSAKKLLDGLGNKDPRLEKEIEKFSELVHDLTDFVSDLLAYLGNLEADPARFEYLQERKAAINSLIKKFGVGSNRDQAFAQLIERYEHSQERLIDLSGGEARIAELLSQRDKIFIRLQKSAGILSQKRIAGAEKLSELVTRELASLSMPAARFVCEVITRKGASFSDYSSTGIDDVSFLFSSHTGSNLLPLTKVASGGENSRVMLAIAVVLAENSSIGTYIFDEVDAGVGGAAAVEVGRRLKTLSHQSQVIVVTHLAQVAVWADQHLLVQKDQSGSVSASDIRALNPEDRKVEIARMLSGQSHSQSAQEHAAELLKLVQNSRAAS
jgi:DNA repair protein RecN (Recombination protein N)